MGAIARSSSFVISKIVNELPHRTRYIVEYGAGDGVITKALLDRIGEGGVIAAIELNPTLVDSLAAIGDTRVAIVPKDIREICADFSVLPMPEVHAVISGIPFTFLSKSDRIAVVRNTFHGLTPGGRFIVYQYSTLMLPYLKKVFPRVKVKLEPRNVFPYFIMTAEK